MEDSRIGCIGLDQVDWNRSDQILASPSAPLAGLNQENKAMTTNRTQVWYELNGEFVGFLLTEAVSSHERLRQVGCGAKLIRHEADVIGCDGAQLKFGERRTTEVGD